MDITTIINSKIFISIISILAGVAIKSLLNKRGLFTYFVTHNRIGISAEDEIYGSVKVTWNDNPVSHLYLSKIELINQSLKDFDSVRVSVFSGDTLLLSQRTEIVGTAKIIEFTDEYESKIMVDDETSPTDQQYDLYRRQRDYIVPTMNRGQKLCFEYLNAAQSEEQPTLWLDVLHKGVKCEFRIPQDQFLGVSQPHAAFVGTLIGLASVAIIITYGENLPIASVALLSFFIGWLVLVPGAYTIKMLNRVRNWIAD